MILRLLLFMVWFAVWLLLCLPLDRESIMLGAPAAFLVYFMTKEYYTGKNLFKNPLRYCWVVPYAALFVWECVKANLDVAYRVIHPDVPIRPGTIKVRTSLKTDLALTFLANSLSLTPGNTTVDIDKAGGFIYIHRLNLDNKTMLGDRLAVVDKFENVLKRIFE